MQSSKGAISQWAAMESEVASQCTKGPLRDSTVAIGRLARFERLGVQFGVAGDGKPSFDKAIGGLGTNS